MLMQAICKVIHGWLPLQIVCAMQDVCIPSKELNDVINIQAFMLDTNLVQKYPGKHSS